MKNDAVPKLNNYKKHGVEFVEVTNNVGMKVTFSNLGASIYSIEYMGELMTSQVSNVEDFLKTNVYNGKALGRVAGRIKNGELKIGNKTFKLVPNEGKNVLHGGEDSLSHKLISARVFATTEHIHVVYTYFSKAGEAGFPGNALLEVHYIVSNNKPKLKIKLLSYVTEKCPISMSVHTYFSLGESNINNMKMQINSSKYLKINSKSLLVGEPLDVPSCLDFRQEKPILQDIKDPLLNEGRLCGYDHTLLLDEVRDDVPQIVLENDKYKVNIFSDFNAVNIYSDNYEDKIAHDNSKDLSRRGMAIEPQLDPSKKMLLDMHEEFDHYIRYEFSKK